MNVSRILLRLLHRKSTGRVGYRMGAKAPSLTADSAALLEADCSGYIQWLLARASRQGMILPAGSWNQEQWCRKRLRKLAQYSDVAYAAADPGRVFICFLPAGAFRRRSARHVWLVSVGRTIESFGGVGAGSRAWDTPALREHANAAFELPTVR